MRQAVLRPTLELLQEHGWVKGALFRDGAHCLVGAVLETIKTQDHLHQYSWDSPTSPFASTSSTREPLTALAQTIQSVFPERLVPSYHGGTGMVLLQLSAWGQCVNFNNHPDTTFADIELVCEKAIADVGEL